MEIGSGEVHIWVAAISEHTARLDAFEELLSDDERERAAAFTRDGGRIRYITGRGMLRLLLSRYLGDDPADIAFTQTRLGKPMLARESGERIFFSLSHSEDLVLVALSPSWEIGVDLEFMRALQVDRLLPLCAAPAEREELERLPARRKRRRFFELWTRKEALAKAVGLGLSVPLRDIVFQAVESEDGRGSELALISAPGAMGDPERWQVVPLEVSEEYVAAVAVPGSDPVLCLRRFEG